MDFIARTGELVALNSGSYDLSCLQGPFRATQDLPAAETTARYAAWIQQGGLIEAEAFFADQTRLPHEEQVIATGSPTSYMLAAAFSVFLLKQGLVAQVPMRVLDIDADVDRKRDLQVRISTQDCYGANHSNPAKFHKASFSTGHPDPEKTPGFGI